VFFILLSFAFGLGWIVRSLLFHSNFVFSELQFNIILDCIEVYLDFSQNYSIFVTKEKKLYFYLSELVS